LKHLEPLPVKVKGFGLVLAIFIGFLFITWAFDTTSLAATQRQYLHWNCSSHVVMIAVWIGAIAIGKKDFAYYGFTLEKWRSDFSVVLICLIGAAGYVPALIYSLIAENGLINTLFHIAAVLLALWFVLNKKSEGVVERRSLRILWLILLIPAITAVVLGG